MRKRRPLLFAALTAAMLQFPVRAGADVVDDNPATASRGAGDTYVLARAGDGATLERHLTPSGWTDWSSIGGVATSGPTAAPYGSAINVFVRGTDNAVYQNALTAAGWRGWESLGGTATSAPAAAWRKGPLNYFDIAVKGIDNAIWFQTFVPGSGWSGWSSLGGNLSSAPALASQSDGVVNVFARGPSGSLYHRAWNGSAWSDWIDLGGVLTSAPTVVTPSPTVVDVYARGTDNATHLRHWDASGGWAPWQRVDPAPIDSAPAAGSDGPGREVLFARRGDRLAINGFGAGAWSGWADFGPVAVPAPPAPAPPPPDGELDLVAGLRCTPPGGKLRVSITVRKRPGRAKARVQRIVVYTKGKGRRVSIDHKAPFSVRLKINRPAGTTGRVYARVYFRRSKHGKLHRKTVSRRYVVCR